MSIPLLLMVVALAGLAFATKLAVAWSGTRSGITVWESGEERIVATIENIIGHPEVKHLCRSPFGFWRQVNRRFVFPEIDGSAQEAIQYGVRKLLAERRSHDAFASFVKRSGGVA